MTGQGSRPGAIPEAGRGGEGGRGASDSACDPSSSASFALGRRGRDRGPRQ